MKKVFLVKLVVLLMTIAMLSGCIWGPRGFGHYKGGHHGKGHHGQDKHDRD